MKKIKRKQNLHLLKEKRVLLLIVLSLAQVHLLINIYLSKN